TTSTSRSAASTSARDDSSGEPMPSSLVMRMSGRSVMLVTEGKKAGRSLGMTVPTSSGRQDLNLRPPDPQSGALPGCATPRQRQKGGNAGLQHRRCGRKPADAKARSARGGRVQDVLQDLAGLEREHAARGDRDLLAGLRVATDAGL